jgi:acyl dehydratase
MTRDPASSHKRHQAAGREFPARTFSYDETKTMLYGLATGMGQEPLDQAELPFVTEANLRALPGLATVVAWDDSWLPQTGIDLKRIVHGEERITLHKPLLPKGEVSASVRILDVFDKGAQSGAVLYVETRLIDLSDGSALTTRYSTILARGDGGFGGPPGGPPPLEAVPDRAPDIAVAYQSLPSQALIYRLLGDRNPLHSDPEFARRAGFERPILHGLCTYGIAVRALVKGLCDHDPARIAHLEARFTAPVFPGDKIVTEMWRTDRGGAFRAIIPDRASVVLDRGKVLWRT